MCLIFAFPGTVAMILGGQDSQNATDKYKHTPEHTLKWRQGKSKAEDNIHP
jgi:hypothetical protein